MTKKITLILIAVIILVGLFVLFKPKTTNNSSTIQTYQIPSKTFEFIIKDRKIASGSGDLKVTEGTKVTFKVTIDEPEELHLHGYDKMLELEANQPGELTFTANLSGRFPFELENSKTDLGVLEVTPNQ
jgi:hypothetical protein